MFGKSHTQEARFKISKNHARLSGKKHANSRSVVCLTTKEVFDSIGVAAKFYNIKNTSNIVESCKGTRKHSGRLTNGLPLIWMYYDVYKVVSKEYIERKIENSFNTYIVCLNNSRIFKGQTEAATNYSIDGSSITKCCKGKQAYAGIDPTTREPLRWAYLLECNDLVKNGVLESFYLAS